MDPDLVAAVMTVESAGDPNAVSYAGAVGLMQVMPRETGFPSRPPAARLLEPDFNLGTGVHILATEIQWAGGDVRKGLMAYYDGRRRALNPLPRTTAYADKVLTRYRAAQVEGLK